MRRAPFALLLVLAAALAGCLRVQPHERERLARPEMILGDRDDLHRGESHARAYREGSSGGSDAQSGGCGCN